ncbi:BCD family MFS transporter [Sphingomonas sp. UV9]|uniref:BCD family MFS transporter n=1 Tax=Sphingomonas sp. UV9 TaxID=1851410 RepID=UPI001F0CD27D|nr:BCD family MFS transporter [Sphingomonas sp. UV9]
MSAVPLGWLGIVRLGLVQSAIGAIVMLATSLLNRVMVVEYALPAALPAGLVAWHYAVQLSRPVWGHGSDRGARRTPWIVAGMAVLALGALLAVGALPLLAARAPGGLALAIAAFAMIGMGVGAAGTSLLALLATRVSPERRAAAAAITWIMMVAGIAVTAGIAGALLDPFSAARLARVAAGVAGCAFVLAVVALLGVEGAVPSRGLATPVDASRPGERSAALMTALQTIWDDGEARRFTLFVFVSMLAYAMQDLILEPFAGLVFGLAPGASTQLAGVQHGGVLVGMIVAGVGGGAFGGGGIAGGIAGGINAGEARGLRWWIVGGCLGSAAALAGLALAAQIGPGWPLTANVALLGMANGVFAVAAIGAMMTLAGSVQADGRRQAGLRMGVWGAAQAIAFGLGGLLGAVGVDLGRSRIGSPATVFTLVFLVEALVFVVAAGLAMRRPGRQQRLSRRARAREAAA